MFPLSGELNLQIVTLYKNKGRRYDRPFNNFSGDTFEVKSQQKTSRCIWLSILWFNSDGIYRLSISTS